MDQARFDFMAAFKLRGASHSARLFNRQNDLHAGAQATVALPPDPWSGIIPVYRVYIMGSDEHFYSAVPIECADQPYIRGLPTKQIEIARDILPQGKAPWIAARSVGSDGAASAWRPQHSFTG
jgi:hypothetical protein